MAKLKYAPLADHLSRIPDARDCVVLTFAEIEEIISAELPRSARTYRQWWNRETSPQAAQKVAWQGAGWDVAGVSIPEGNVIFVRSQVGPPKTASGRPPASAPCGRITFRVHQTEISLPLSQTGLDAKHVASEAIRALEGPDCTPLHGEFWRVMDNIASPFSEDVRWRRRFWMTAAGLVTPSGHPYFRAALANLELGDKGRGCRCLQKSYQADKAHAAAGAKDLSAYVALVVLTEWDGLRLSPQLVSLFERAFDAAIVGSGPPRDRVSQAIETIADHDDVDHCRTLFEELQCCHRRQGIFASVALAGALVEALLSSRLFNVSGRCEVALGYVSELDLGGLIEAASTLTDHLLLSSDLLEAFHLVRVFRNRVHPGREVRRTRDDCQLTPRIAHTVSLLTQLSLIEWASRIGTALPSP